MKKYLLATITAISAIPAMVLPVLAAGTANAAITGAFDTLVDDVTATMAPIGVAAISLFAILLAWKFAKKIFNRVAS